MDFSRAAHFINKLFLQRQKRFIFFAEQIKQKKIMKNIFSLLLVVFSLSQLRAQDNKIKFTEYDLDNGLHVILHEDHTTPNVAVSVLYHVGSKNEDPKRTGFAHFFEHLLFEGSDHIERGEYMKLIQSNGGTLNANTSFDRTYYFELMPSNYLEMALWMESERMAYAKIDEVGLETQREVIKEEKRLRYENTPYGRLLEQIMKNSYTTHPYRWTPIGEAQYIDQATLPEFMDFYKTFYVPNNATLTIAGDIEPEQAKKWVSKYFSTIPKGTKPIPRPTEVEAPWTKERIDTFYDNVQLPAIVASYHIPNETNPDFYAIEMLSTLLSTGKSSRMYRSLVEEKQLALQSTVFPLPTEDPGLYISLSIINPGSDPKDALDAMDAEVVKVQNELISDKELEKIRNIVEDDFVSGVSSISSIGEQLANYHVYYGNTDLINTQIQKYLAVTKEDIQRVAKKYLVPTNRSVLYYLPKSN